MNTMDQPGADHQPALVHIAGLDIQVGPLLRQRLPANACAQLDPAVTA